MAPTTLTAVTAARCEAQRTVRAAEAARDTGAAGWIVTMLTDEASAALAAYRVAIDTAR